MRSRAVGIDKRQNGSSSHLSSRRKNKATICLVWYLYINNTDICFVMLFTLNFKVIRGSKEQWYKTKLQSSSKSFTDGGPMPTELALRRPPWLQLPPLLLLHRSRVVPQCSADVYPRYGGNYTGGSSAKEDARKLLQRRRANQSIHNRAEKRFSVFLSGTHLLEHQTRLRCLPRRLGLAGALGCASLSRMSMTKCSQKTSKFHR